MFFVECCLWFIAIITAQTYTALYNLCLSQRLKKSWCVYWWNTRFNFEPVVVLKKNFCVHYLEWDVWINQTSVVLTLVSVLCTGGIQLLYYRLPHNDLLFDAGSKTLTASVASHMLPLRRQSKGPFTLCVNFRRHRLPYMPKYWPQPRLCNTDLSLDVDLLASSFW